MLRNYYLEIQEMPQESLRSVVYRPFIKCNDSNGVVECGTIRKSKRGYPKMERKIKSQRALKNPKKSLASKAETEEMISSTEEFHSPSSIQLMEVSRGAKKLNHLIDSWYNGPKFDGQSKDIAKDLLKGALDLQESLIMLGKLQEASQYMAQLRRSQKEKSERRITDEMEIERTTSKRFNEQNYQMGSQRPWLSAEGSSRDCIGELKKVIRESFARQNLLQNTITEDGIFFQQRNIDSASDIPSTSSSQSSVVYSNNFVSTDFSVSSEALPKKVKRSNLIAKLMGLEELSTKPTQTTLLKKMESQKIMNQRKPIVSIDKLNIRRPQSLVQKEGPGETTLKEILESMQYKGLLKSNSVKEPRYNSHQYSDSYSRGRLSDNVPPIVLIKPVHVPYPELEEPLAPSFLEEGSFNTKMMLRRPKGKGKPPSKSIGLSEASLNPNKTHRKMEEEDRPVKRLTKKEAANYCKEIAKPEDKVIKIEEKSSNKMKASGHVTHQPQKKDTRDKQVDKIPKLSSAVRNPEEKETIKLKSMAKSQDQQKVTATNPRKPKQVSNTTMHRIPLQQSTTPSMSIKHKTQTIIHKSTERKRSTLRTEKLVSEPKPAKLNTENLGCSEDGKNIDHSHEDDLVEKRVNHQCENDPLMMKNWTGLADQLPTQEITDIAELQIEEYCNNSQSSSCDDMRPISLYGRDPQSSEVYKYTSHIGTESKSIKTGINLRRLLSSSPSFLSHAGELFDLDANTFTILEASDKDDFGDANLRFTMDCANEFIERKSLPDSRTVHPLLPTCSWNSKISLSLDQLLVEICNGVEALGSYGKPASENLHTDSLSAILERDIRCKGMVSGLWDMGWRNGFSVNVVEQIVYDIEKLILDGLIDELFR
ncbi:DUF4378 domain-containing protein [Cephalotus follicularis]|uniref:DUF4378 domain-containing protein n=1 Tax=Cephalotus follicularis TaxID=3775 RepID=A0A1Q3CE71_CEPFO|nr:DUF4378 domain-containing protein [Cephalotus follicularis]